MNNQIITSVLDTDKYEHTMKLAMHKKHPNFIGKWLEGSIPDARDDKYNSSIVSVEQSTNNCGLKIISEGLIAESSMWEMPTLSIVSELYFRDKYKNNYG